MSVLHNNVDPSEPFDLMQYAFQIGRTMYLKHQKELDESVTHAQKVLGERGDPTYKPKSRPNHVTKEIVDLLSIRGPMEHREILHEVGHRVKHLNNLLCHLKRRGVLDRNGKYGGRWHINTDEKTNP